MRKLMSISLIVVLVLAIGAMAFAAEGSLNSGETLEATIPVYANIGPYAEIKSVRELDFGTLLGAVDVYDTYAEGAQHGQFELEANTGVQITFAVEHTDWIASPYKFVAMGTAGFVGYNAPFGKWEGIGPTNLINYGYYKGGTVFDIAGYIEIESISQQRAAQYNTNILVTVSK